MELSGNHASWQMERELSGLRPANNWCTSIRFVRVIVAMKLTGTPAIDTYMYNVHTGDRYIHADCFTYKVYFESVDTEFDMFVGQASNKILGYTIYIFQCGAITLSFFQYIFNILKRAT